MRIFQRFEVWLLILAGLGAVWWSFQPGPALSEPTAADPINTGAALQLRRCTLVRDFGNARLDLDVRYKNASPRPLFMQPPDVRLLNAKGKEVPPFILPSERPVSVEAQTTADLRLRFWLEESDLAGALTLEIRDQRLEVKDSTPLNLQKLSNGKPQEWTHAAWEL